MRDLTSFQPSQLNKLMVTKSNKLLRAGGKLSPNERKLLSICVGKINPNDAVYQTSFSVTAAEFAERTGIDVRNAYEALKEAEKHLFQREITIFEPDPKIPGSTHTKMRWISGVTYNKAESTITLGFGNEIIPHLYGLISDFTSYDFENVAYMKGEYSMMLCEYLMQFVDTGYLVIKYSLLRELLEIGSKYFEVGDFIKRVIEPAVREINSESEIYITNWRSILFRGKTDRFEFRFKKKVVEDKKLSSIKPRPMLNIKPRI